MERGAIMTSTMTIMRLSWDGDTYEGAREELVADIPDRLWERGNLPDDYVAIIADEQGDKELWLEGIRYVKAGKQS
jgi:hypothetical protein